MTRSSDNQRTNPSDQHITEILQSTSDSYEDMPETVSQRLDTVLANLPSAETLHPEKPSLAKSWSRRFQMPRFRYALASAATALVVTVGGVWIASQIAETSDPETDPPAVAGEDETTDEETETPREDDEGDDDDVGAFTSPEPDGPDSEAEEESTPQPPSESAIDTHTSGDNYNSEDDLAEALRDLAEEDEAADVPDELGALYSNAELWERCQDLILRHYDAIPILADFAEFEDEAAMVIFLVGEEGDLVTVLGPECGVQDVDEQFLQPAS